jgi:hypothetical protein
MRRTTADGELLTLRYFFGNEELFLMEKTDDAFKMTEQSVELDYAGSYEVRRNQQLTVCRDR